MSELCVRIMKLRATALALRDPAARDALLAIATGMDAGLDLLTPSAGRASVAEGRGHLGVICAERSGRSGEVAASCQSEHTARGFLGRGSHRKHEGLELRGQGETPASLSLAEPSHEGR